MEASDNCATYDSTVANRRRAKNSKSDENLCSGDLNGRGVMGGAIVAVGLAIG